MSLTISIVSEHRDLVGDDAVREFHEVGGTIGRSLQNDWILPDPDRFISGRHATIDYKGGIYYLADTSSNGVYMNGERMPVGKGNPRRLFDGDHMRMGDFEFEVRIDRGESIVMPLDPDKPSVAPDNIEQFVDEDEPEYGMQLLDEAEITGDAEFQSVLFGKAPPVKVEPEPEPQAAPAKPARETVEVSAEDLFDSFLNGLGVNRVELHPAIDREEMMITAGLVLREFVEGSIKLLASRANLKNAFRLDETTLLPRHNNPMKFSNSTNDLIKQLLVGGEGEYLGARDSVREVCRDLLNHQNAFLDAMNSAFIEFADRFDPEELRVNFDQTLDSKFFKFLDKFKYWDLYCGFYPIMTEKGGGRFPKVFGEKFVKAYERQVADYRRFSYEGLDKPAHKKPTRDQHTDTALLATQKLVRPAVAASVVTDRASNEEHADSPAGNSNRDKLRG